MKPDELRELIGTVIAGDAAELRGRLGAFPEGAIAALSPEGGDLWLASISHYLYGGDTALHAAAAAFQGGTAAVLVEFGADVRARNRRGAEPLHYAADANHRAPERQAETIRYLLSAGADPNARDRSGVAPLHRAVRTRSAAAVQALLELGASAGEPNGSGSTPLHLAVQSTGRGGAGAPEVLAEQAAIIRLLLHHGAAPAAVNSAGRTPSECATAAAGAALRAFVR